MSVLVILSLAAHALFAVCLGAAAVTAKFPPPQSGPLVPVWRGLNWLALNKGYAANAVAVVDSNLPASK